MKQQDRVFMIGDRAFLHLPTDDGGQAYVAADSISAIEESGGDDNCVITAGGQLICGVKLPIQPIAGLIREALKLQRGNAVHETLEQLERIRRERPRRAKA